MTSEGDVTWVGFKSMFIYDYDRPTYRPTDFTNIPIERKGVSKGSYISIKTKIKTSQLFFKSRTMYTRTLIIIIKGVPYFLPNK